MKRAQVTIFIIVAILIVTAILLFFLFLNNRNPINPLQPEPTNPDQYIQKCVKDEALKTIDILLRQGGYLHPTLYKTYNTYNVGYLCYTGLYYVPCTTQEPVLIKHLEDEISQGITLRVETCFEDLKSELGAKGYTVSLGSMQIKTQLLTNRAKIEVYRKIDLTKNEENKKIEQVNTIFNSPLYDLAIVAHEIASREAKVCNFDYVQYSWLHSEYKITKTSVGSGLQSSRIYTIKDRNTGKTLNMAIRSCAIPAGL